MKSKILLAVFISLGIFTDIPCFADDPCVYAKEKLNILADALNYNADTTLPSNGLFKVTPHKKRDNTIEWYEVAYISQGKIISEGVIQNWYGADYEEYILSAGDNGKKIQIIYQGGRTIACLYALTIDDGKFKVYNCYETDFNNLNKPIKLEYFNLIDSATYYVGNQVNAINLSHTRGNFTYEIVPLKNERYILKTEGTEVIFLKINGKIIVLNNKHHVGTKNEEYAGLGYNATLVTKTSNNVESGTLEISFGSAKTRLNIHGKERLNGD